MNEKLMTDVTSATSSAVTLSARGVGSSETIFFLNTATGGQRSSRDRKKVTDAVYTHIRAMRALGHSRVNSWAIARALSLPINEVEAAMRNLRDKGVRVIE